MSDKYPGGLVTAAAPAGYSVVFDGSGDYIVSSSSVSNVLGAGDFTIEFWMLPINTSSAYRALVSSENYSATTGGWSLYQNGTAIEFWLSPGGSVTLNATSAVVANTWQHLALCRASGTLRLFVNGVQAQSVSNSTSLTGQQFWIGGNNSGSFFFNGYMSNVRVVIGTALYTTTFTPPTQLFRSSIAGSSPSWNASLLTCNSPTIIDQSSSNLTFTVFGNSAVSTFTPFPSSYYFYNAPTNGNTRSMVPSNIAGFNPAYGAAAPGVWTLDQAQYFTANRLWPIYDPYFNLTTLMLSGNSPTGLPTWITDVSTNNFAITVSGDARAANLSPFSLTTFPNSGSGYFDGTSDYINTPTSAAVLGTNNWTFECWVYLNAKPAFGQVLGMRQSTSTNAFVPVVIAIDTTGFSFYSSDNGSSWNINNATAFGGTAALNQWYHVAVVRNGSTITGYVNGAATTLKTGVTSNYTSTSGIYVGGSTTGDAVNGYVSNVRVVNGTAVYTGAFTVPTAPLGATQSAGTNISAITGTSTALLILQNSQSSNNNSFLDSSSNNFLIARNGNTTQGTFSPFSQTGWSNFFDGTGDYLTAATSSQFAAGSVFTIEMWVYPTTAGNSTNYFAVNVSDGIQVGFNGTTSWGLANFSVAWLLTTTTLPTLNSWNHIAICRSGTGTNQTSIFLNGTRVANGTVSNAFTTTGAASIGATFAGVGPFTGFMSQIRFVAGTAVYDPAQATITVPTAPLTAITNTRLLTCQSNRFVDNSTNTFPLTVNGNTSVLPFSPFAPTIPYNAAAVGGSGYFDGTGDWLSNASMSPTLTLGTSNFCIEAWGYWASFNEGTYGAPLISFGGTSSQLMIRANKTSGNSTSANYYFVNNNTFIPATGFSSGVSGGTIFLNCWNHIAVTRQGSTFRLFVNGALVNTQTDSGNFGTAYTRVNIGSDSNPVDGRILGYVAGARMVTGDAVYTAAFTPPTAPPTPISGTYLLTNFTNAGIIDATAKSDLETVGNAQISTAQSRFGGSSIAFDGSTSYLIGPPDPSGSFGAGNLTIEGWVYFNNVSTNPQIVAQVTNGSSGSNYSWQLYLVSANTLRGALWVGGTQYAVDATIAATTWYHVALVRNGTTISLYVNGTSVGTPSTIGTNAINWYSDSRFYMGRNSTAIHYFNGFVDDFRIARFARYTANFVPPTSALQLQ